MFCSMILSSGGLLASEIGNDISAAASIYLFGGHNGSILNTIRKFNISALTSSQISAVLMDGARYGGQTGYSLTTAYSIGGVNANSALYVMDALNMTNDTAYNPANGALSSVNGQPYNGHTYNTLTSSLFCGGIDPYGPTYSGKQYQLVHATDTISTMTGKLLPIATVTQLFNHCATSKTNGYKVNGAVSSTLYTDIYRMSFATFTEGLIAAKLSTGRAAALNLQTETISYTFGGGAQSGNTHSTTIDKLDMTTETNGIHSATCAVSIAQSGGGSSSSTGFSLGGWSASGVTNEIQGVDFASGTAVNQSQTLVSAVRLASSSQI